MRKTIKILFTLTFIFLLFGCGGNNNDGCGNQQVNETDLNAVIQRMERNETFITVFGSHGCPACQSYRPTISDFARNTSCVEILYVYFDYFTKEEFDQVQTQFNVQFTPTTVMFKDGEIVAIIPGAISLQDLIQLYEENLK